MAEVWYCIPTARPELATATFKRWHERGYHTAALIDGPAPDPGEADLIIRAERYRGYAASCNLLMRTVADSHDPPWFVLGGDDLWPDPAHHAGDIARECEAHFGGTFGVMQPCGDDYGATRTRAALVSPWIGRAWRRRLYGGNGPLWEEYEHFYEDGEHMDVANMLGRLWWRDDITHYHDHWLRKGEREPEHLARKAGVSEKSRAIYLARKAAGFPGHQPLPE